MQKIARANNLNLHQRSLSTKLAIYLAFLACVLLLLCACGTTSPYAKSNQASSNVLLDQQLAAAQSRIKQGGNGHIIFAGFAMHDQSKAFRGDIDLVEKRLRELDPAMVSIKLANPPLLHSADLPYATSENILQTLAALAGMVRPQDKVVLLFSSHGIPQRLGIHAANTPYPSLDPTFIRGLLAKFPPKTPVVALISACYSGSFFPALAAQERVLLAAAREDRASFGCQFHGARTFFIDGLFGRSWSRQKSLLQLFADGGVSIAAQEKEKRFLFSEPQMFIGNTLRQFARIPMHRWSDFQLR